MITDKSKNLLHEIYLTLRNAPHPDDRLLLGAIEAAFHIGQIETGAEIMASIANLAESKASKPTDGIGANWAAGYVEAGNDLMELFMAKVDDLKEQIAKADGLSELATLIDPDG